MRAAREKHRFSAHHLYQGFVLAKSSLYSNGGPTFAFVFVHLLFAFIPNLQAVGCFERGAIPCLARHSSIPKALYLASAYQAFASDCAISLTYGRRSSRRGLIGASWRSHEADPIADHAGPAAVRPLDVPHQREALEIGVGLMASGYPDHQSGKQFGERSNEACDLVGG